jgi:adenylate kinase
MKYIIFGAQASGKGTQAEMLAKELGLKHISAGELLRQEVAAGSHHGKLIKAHQDKGELVPNELVYAVIKKAIQDSHGKFILDGFPRTQAQAEWLDLNVNIDKVIVLKISDKTAVERIGGRRECPNGHTYHVKFNPPKREGICDQDSLPLRQRTDDTAAAIMKRLQIYHEQTKPVIDHYKTKVVEIDGEPNIKDVHIAVMKAVHHR